MATYFRRWRWPGAQSSTASPTSNGEPITSANIQRQWFKTISYIPQSSMNSLNPVVRIGKQFIDYPGIDADKKRVLEAVREFIGKLDLPVETLDAYPHQLSGGMRQRVMIAMATFFQPHLILADEPTTALDVVVQKEILLLLMELQEQMGNTILLVSHDMGVHYQVTHRMLIMYAAKAVEYAASETVVRSAATSLYPHADPLAADHRRRPRASRAFPAVRPACGAICRAVASPIAVRWRRTDAGPRSRLFSSTSPAISPRATTPAPNFPEARGAVMTGHSAHARSEQGLSTRHVRPQQEDTVRSSDVSIDVESDRPVIISVVGESGSGKTTLAKTLLRLIEPSSGSAMVHDTPVAGKGVRIGRKEFLGTVQPIFQNPFEAFSRYRPVDAYLHETATPCCRASRVPTCRQRSPQALNLVGLDYADVHGKYTNQFSGGELQRVSVARALIPQPKLIVADEPVVDDRRLASHDHHQPVQASCAMKPVGASFTSPTIWRRPITSPTTSP